MKLVCRLGLILLGLFVFPMHVVAAEPELDIGQEGKRFIESYRSQYMDILDAYATQSAQVRVTGYRGSSEDPQQEIEFAYDFYSKGEKLKRLDETRPPTAEGVDESPRRQVIMVNEHGYLIARNEGNQGAMVLIEKAADPTIGIRRIEMMGVPGCQFCIFGVPLDQWIFDIHENRSNYRIHSFKRDYQQEREVVHLKAEYELDSELGHWSLTLDEQTGVVLEYELGSSNPNGRDQSRHAKIRYEFSEDSPPRVKEMVTWVTGGGQETVYNKQTHEVTQFDFSPPDEAVFYPDAIGLDLDYSEGASWLWYACIALIFLVAAVVLRMRAVANAK